MPGRRELNDGESQQLYPGSSLGRIDLKICRSLARMRRCQGTDPDADSISHCNRPD